MTRLFTDGAESGGTHAFYSADADFTASTTLKRSGTYSYRSGTDDYCRIAIPDTNELFLRFGYATNNAGNELLTKFSDLTNTIISLQWYISTHKLKVVVGSTTISEAYVLPSMFINTWYLVEVYIKVANSGGAIQVKLDNNLIYSYTGDTLPSTYTDVNFVGLGCPYNAYSYIDDLAINDTQGDSDNSWCGDGHIIALSPNAPGDINELTPTSGSAINNYQMVDETPPDNDTTYVEGDTAENYDLYNFSACGIDPNTQEISRLWVAITAKDTTTGSGIISPLIKTSGSVVESDGIELRTTYSHCKSAEYVINPMTGLPWTTDEVDSLQAGVRIKN